MSCYENLFLSYCLSKDFIIHFHYFNVFIYYYYFLSFFLHFVSMILGVCYYPSLVIHPFHHLSHCYLLKDYSVWTIFIIYFLILFFYFPVCHYLWVFWLFYHYEQAKHVYWIQMKMQQCLHACCFHWFVVFNFNFCYCKYCFLRVLTFIKDYHYFFLEILDHQIYLFSHLHIILVQFHYFLHLGAYQFLMEEFNFNIDH